MTKLFNRKSQKEKRRSLRNNMTKAEEMLWKEIKNKKLGVRFLRQYSIGSYVVDFYCSSLKLAIEVDGLTHITQDEIKYDNNREEEINNLNIKFLRFTNEEVYIDMNAVLEKIRIEIETLKQIFSHAD